MVADFFREDRSAAGSAPFSTSPMMRRASDLACSTLVAGQVPRVIHFRSPEWGR